MTTLVIGASGATGKLVVKELLEQGDYVKLVVRDPTALPDELIKHDKATVIKGDILSYSIEELRLYVEDCNAVISCLGHNLTPKGIFGYPQRLVTLAVERLCQAIQQLKPSEPIKFILMNSTGNKNTLANEKTSLMHTLVVGLIRYLVPPHADNEQAAKHLQSDIGLKNKSIEWVVVRPDTLINEVIATHYLVHSSPVRSAIFDAGKTSRINVAHFMSQLVFNHNTWKKWRGEMPVIYDQE